MRSLWLQIIGSFGARIYVVILELATLIFTAYVLGSEGRGALATIVAWVGMFAGVFGLSLGQVVIHRLTTGASSARITELFYALGYLSVFLVVCGWIAALVVYGYSNEGALGKLPHSFVLLGFFILPLLIWDSYLKHFLSALGRLLTYNRQQVIGQSIGFVLMVLTILLLGAGIYGALIGIASALLLTVILSLRSLGGLIMPPLGISRSGVISLVKSGMALHINTIGSYMLMQADVIILGHYRILDEVGWYQAATQLIGLPLIFPTIVTLVLYGRTTELGPDAAWGIQRSLIRQVMFLMGAAAVFGYFLAPAVIPVVLGPQFEPTTEVFRILLLAMIGMSFAQLLVSQWIARGLFLQAGMITIVTGIINISLNLIYIPQYGMMAAAWTTVGSFVFALFTNMIFAIWIERRWCLSEKDQSTDKLRQDGAGGDR